MRDAISAFRYAMQMRDRQLVSYLTPAEKREVLASYARRATTFIETGTYYGETARAMAPHYSQVHTVEIEPKRAEQARISLADIPNVEVHTGDSATVLPRILGQVERSAVIWLDAHYSGSHTGRAAGDTPIVDELRCIFAHSREHHIVLIDDARLFVGRRGYPTLSALGRFVRAESDYELTVRDDIVRLIFDPEWSVRHRDVPAAR